MTDKRDAACSFSRVYRRTVGIYSLKKQLSIVCVSAEKPQSSDELSTQKAKQRDRIMVPRRGNSHELRSCAVRQFIANIAMLLT